MSENISHLPSPADCRRAAAPGGGRCGRRLGLRAVAFMIPWLCLAAAAPLRAQTGANADGGPDTRVSTDELLETWGVGPWIWSPETHDKQTCRFWRSFEIPHGAEVASARIRISVDNGYHLMLDGRQIGVGSDWRSITEYDLGRFLKPGIHVVAIEGFNDNREAGLQFGMRIELTDGRTIVILSDKDWRIVPPNVVKWDKMHQAPTAWGNAIEVGALLPRPEDPRAWYERKPTMLMKLVVPPPVKLGFLQSIWFQVALWTLATVAVLLCLRLMARLTMQSKAQELLNRERSRIARDIHDELGARLTELALEGEVIQTELPPGSPAGLKLEALCEKARAASGAMDELVWVLNSRRDTLRDFTTYACKHVHRFLEPTPIRCRLDVDADLPEVALDLPVRRSLLLAVKEAVNNAAKYSGASELFLRIHHRGQVLHTVVEDNGKGFDLDRADETRNGLSNMAERMKEIDGKCRITTRPGSGCRVEFQVPLKNPPARNHSSNGQSSMPLEKIHGEQAGSAALFDNHND